MQKDRWIGLGTIVLALVCMWDLNRTPPRRFGMAVLSSTDFPTVVVWVLLAFGVLLVASTLRPFRRGRALTLNADGPRVNSPPKKTSWRAPGFLLAATVVYVYATPVFGFYPATAVYLCGAVYVGAPVPRRWLPASLISAVSILVIYAVFHLWLNFFLPRGSVW